MRQALTAIRATGAELRQPYYLALLAEACGKRPSRGRACDADRSAGSGRQNWRALGAAELHRLKGSCCYTALLALKRRRVCSMPWTLLASSRRSH
jgi:hypothetical protein